MPSSVERGTCHVCGDEAPIDGDHATERFGEVLCRGCASKPVAFVAGCDNQFCEFEHRVGGREFNRGHIETNARMEANNHETEERVFREDPMHNTTVSEVDPDDD